MLNPAAENRAASTPLIRPDSRDRPLTWRDGRAIFRGEFVSDVQRLAKRLPEKGAAVNFCTDRYYFTVALAAVALRGHVSHLPHDRTNHSLTYLSNAHPDLYCLLDSDDRPFAVPCIRVDGIPSAPPSDNRIPSLLQDQLVAEVYTGGSTGEPQPNAKTWGALTEGAWRIAAGLNLADHPDATILATVPPQHMFGLELSVMVPLCQSMPLWPAKPFYPADIERAVAEIPGPVVLVTTPVHLKAMAGTKPVLPGLVKVVSATAPLAKSLAEQIEALYGSPVLEIYGCSEGGSLASRRTVSDAAWQTLEDISLHAGDDACEAHVPYLPDPVTLQDVVEVLSPTEFVLRGRTSEMINLAGKRASLSGLNAILNEIDGVEDGTFFVPPDESADSVIRLGALVVAPGLDEAAIRRGLRDRVDPVFIPRPIFLVGSLPRSETGKLSAAALAAMIQRVHEERA